MYGEQLALSHKFMLAGSDIADLGINSLKSPCLSSQREKAGQTYLIGVNVSKPFAAVQGKPFFFAAS